MTINQLQNTHILNFSKLYPWLAPMTLKIFDEYCMVLEKIKTISLTSVAMDNLQIVSLVVTYLIVVIQFHQSEDGPTNTTWHMAQLEDEI